MIWFTARRLDWALRTRGPALHAWPDAERRAALALLRRNPCARRVLADALAAEDAPAPDPHASCRMRSVVRAALSPAPVERGLRWGALAAGLAAGLWVGLIEPASEQTGFVPTMQATVPGSVLAALEP